MATAPAVRESNFVLHTRASWAGRDDRIASVVWLGVLWIGMILGFAVDFPRYLRENPPAPLIVHLHAVVFSTWMLLLTSWIHRPSISTILR
jgi:hypothetical protein